ncbi:MAG: RnfABCDGE type electron transport complex subunit B [Lachnospiraceae bacterium]|nr:RnfABCDGE type electron transport complex subunit B [Lachnospiraceae bacterium]
MTGIITATAVVAAVGLFIGIFLGLAAIQFRVEVDPKEELVLEALPGNNCGGCGFAGCSGLAAAIAKGEARVSACPVGGAEVAGKIAEIMGVESEEMNRMTAFVMCKGTCDKTASDYVYTGVEDCKMVSFVPGGGAKSCNYGCHGYGNCVRACSFDAIHIVDGVALVDKEACTACGRCVEACPKHLIELVPYTAKHLVACSSKDKGPVVMKACQTGCIGCQICKKNCPSDAIEITDFLAKIDYDKCTGCGICEEKCPKKAIV